MTPLLQLLAAELEKPRPLPPQVIKHIAGTYGVSRDGVSEFLLTQLGPLEDYEIDLVLSPAFTPTLSDQAVVAEHLGQQSVPESEWPGLITALAARPTRAALLGEDETPIVVSLREVTIERYVRRLRLQATIPTSLFELIRSLPLAQSAPGPDPTMAIARRAVWNTESRRQILSRFLGRADQKSRTADAVALLTLVETYEPADSEEILRRLPHWQAVLRHELGMASGPKLFLNERVEELHGGGRDQRRHDGTRVDAKQRDLEFLSRLEVVLAD